MRNTIITLAIPFLLAVGCEYGISTAPGVEIKAPIVAQPLYVNGKIISPNAEDGMPYVVFDAEGLNKAMGECEQGIKDYTPFQLDSIYNRYGLSVDFPEELPIARLSDTMICVKDGNVLRVSFKH